METATMARRAEAPQRRSVNEKVIRICAILFLLAGIIYLACEAITAAAWHSPTYQYAYNYVSDLGIPIITHFDGRAIHSPLHFVMNFGFFANGILFAIAYYLLLSEIQTKAKPIGYLFATIFGVGIVMVGMFPGYDWWGEWIHGIGAMMAIVVGNLAVMLAAMLSSRFIGRKWSVAFSVIMCVVGIASFAVFISIDNNPYAAVFERISVYTVMVWDIIFGCILYRKSCIDSTDEEALHQA